MGFKGQRFGKYVLERKLGEGLAGEVWKAKPDEGAPGAGGAVAVKIFDEPGVVGIVRQSPLPRTPGHVNVARVLAGDFEASPPYLVTELLEGASLRGLMNALKYVPLAGAIPCAIQMVRGLASLHANNLAHLDLRPENVLIDERGNVKLVDIMPLEYRKELVKRAIEKKVAVQKPERAEALLRYLPPEQRRGQFEPAKGDMFQLGVVLYEMLTGKRPEGFDIRYPSQADKRIPKILDEICLRCFEKILRARLDNAMGLEPMLTDGLQRAGFNIVLAGDPARWVQKTPWMMETGRIGEETGKFKVIFDRLTAPPTT